MLQVMDEIEVQGLDVMSAGVTLAWATEAFARGLITETETDGVTLAFGDATGYIEAVQRITTQPTDFYRALARGAEHAAALYGGLDFALAFGGNEMPGYHTGPACHVGWLAGARHSHLDNAGYSLDQNAVKKGQTLTPEFVGETLVKEERWRQVLTSLVVCLFARGVYDRDTVLGALAATGFPWDASDLERLGAETLRRKTAFKQREGFDFGALRVPQRIIDTPSPAGPFDEAFVREAIESYSNSL